MAYLRFRAIEALSNNEPVVINPPSSKISDYFGMNAFGLDKMKETLSPDKPGYYFFGENFDILVKG